VRAAAGRVADDLATPAPDARTRSCVSLRGESSRAAHYSFRSRCLSCSERPLGSSTWREATRSLANGPYAQGLVKAPEVALRPFAEGRCRPGQV